eukprot:7385608-Prymnesium_polylepis.2
MACSGAVPRSRVVSPWASVEQVGHLMVCLTRPHEMRLATASTIPRRLGPRGEQSGFSGERIDHRITE